MRKQIQGTLLAASIFAGACSGPEAAPNIAPQQADTYDEDHGASDDQTRENTTTSTQELGATSLTDSLSVDEQDTHESYEQIRIEVLFDYKDKVSNLEDVPVLRDYCAIWPNAENGITIVRNPIAHIENVFNENDGTFIFQVFFTSTLHPSDQRETLLNGPHYQGYFGTPRKDLDAQESYSNLSQVWWVYIGPDQRINETFAAPTDTEVVSGYTRQKDDQNNRFRLIDKNGLEISQSILGDYIDVASLSVDDRIALCRDPSAFYANQNTF